MFHHLRMSRASSLKSLLASIVLLSVPSLESEALEKRAELVDLATEDGGWASGCSSGLHYYNICTGWIWVWSGWEPDDQFGVVYGPLEFHCDNQLILYSSHYTLQSAPAGYGYTGTISLYQSTSEGCTIGSPLDTRPFLSDGIFTTVNWGSGPISPYFAIVLTMGPTPGNPMSFATDRPAAGPTGPDACGVCYPSDRIGHSFFYEDAGASLCPAGSFNDGICDAELFWDANTIGISFVGTVSVEATSWGQIKSLYR